MAEIAARNALNAAIKRNALNPVETQFLEGAVFKSDAMAGAIVALKGINLALNDMEGISRTSDAAASNDVKGEGMLWLRIYYLICGIIGLIGGYKVYVKVQLGEDLGKSVWLWFAASLFLFVVGILVQNIFFT
jgi:hypothetical protein